MTPHQGVTTRREGGWHYTIYLMRRPAPLYWPGVERLKIRRIMAAPVPAESSEYIGIKRITKKFEIANCKRASIMHCATVLRSTRNAHSEIWCYKNANFYILKNTKKHQKCKKFRSSKIQKKSSPGYQSPKNRWVECSRDPKKIHGAPAARREF